MTPLISSSLLLISTCIRVIRGVIKGSKLQSIVYEEDESKISQRGHVDNKSTRMASSHQRAINRCALCSNTNIAILA